MYIDVNALRFIVNAFIIWFYAMVAAVLIAVVVIVVNVVRPARFRHFRNQIFERLRIHEF